VTSLSQELAGRLRTRIDAGELAPGERLPTVRELAATEHVSPAVVGQAYAQLARDGWVVARVGRGTFVSRPADGPRAPLVDLGLDRRAGTVSATLELQERLAAAARPGSINLASGVPAVDPEVEAAVQAEIVRAVEQDADALFRYASPQGELALREVVAADLARRGVDSDPARVLIATSGQQAVDLAVRAVVEPGDSVLCETPTYAGAIDALVAARTRIVPVPVDAFGLQIDAVERAVSAERPRLLYLNPTAQNPTGTILAPERRARLARLAAEAGLVVVEDDTAAELAYEGDGPPPVAAYEPDAPVIVVKSFAKTVLPGLALGALSSPATLERALLAAKLVADRYTNPPLALPLARYLASPRAAGDVRRARAAYHARKDAFCESLARRLGRRATWVEPRGGASLWLRLPDDASELEVFGRAAERGVVVGPGSAYVPPGVATRHLRLSFSAVDAAEADEGVRRLALALRDVTARGRRAVAPGGDALAV
jgi:DNA-binding transcriptional MocR family regulator